MDSRTRPAHTTGKPTLLVAMGASAGAIEAWQALFEAIPANTGVAFMLVLHLDPTRTSHIAEILQARTENVTITQTEWMGTSLPAACALCSPMCD